jgi:hypothetical protein
MAKELPFFKFNVSEWILGRISDQEDKVQGAFIVAICHYWHKKCDYFCKDFEKKIGKKRYFLLKSNQFFIEKNDKVCIPFLDEQFNELSDLQGKRSESGKKGRAAQLGQTPDKRQANVQAKLGHLDKEIDKEKEIDKDYVLLKKEPKEILPEAVYFENDFLLNEKYKEFLKFRKQIKSPIVETSINANKKRLMNISGNNGAVAIEILERSIAHGWKGFFELETFENKKQNGNSNDNKWFSRTIS